MGEIGPSGPCGFPLRTGHPETACRGRRGRVGRSDRVRADAGFTLVEVLVAMIILALGLLGLEALGIGAARSIALADRQSDYATIASDSLESAMYQLRQGTLPTQFCQTDLRFGDRLSREVDLATPQLAQVTVTALPNPDSFNAPTTNFVLSSSLYLPTVPGGAVQGTPCS